MNQQGKTKILVVDDSQEAREKLSAIIKEIPEAELVGTAAHGMGAIEMVGRLKPDLMLLDIIMPQLDGFGVMEYLGEHDMMPEIIVISALTQETSCSAHLI